MIFQIIGKHIQRDFICPSSGNDLRSYLLSKVPQYSTSKWESLALPGMPINTEIKTWRLDQASLSWYKNNTSCIYCDKLNNMHVNLNAISQSANRVYRLEQIADNFEKQIERNSLKFVGVTVHPEYEVSIELNLKRNTNSMFSNIFTFISDVPPSTEGFRNPSVFLHKKSTRLEICCGVVPDDSWTLSWNSNPMPINTWFKLTIKQSKFQSVSQGQVRSKYVYEIFINDELMYQIVNKNPKTFRNVNGYMGNTGIAGEWPTQLPAGKYKNFEFKSE